ncbi:MAG: DUF4003 family protein [Lachnospiraceae bacterium]|nr:DUF4003 family protein [Lachnospiraceae bacterium]
MNSVLKERVELLAKNREVFAKNFKWSHALVYPVAGLIYTGEGKLADKVKLSESKKILTKNAGCFSSFRNNLYAAVVSKMSLSDNPSEYLERAKKAYDELKRGRVFGTDYIALTALGLADLQEGIRVEEIIDKTKKIMHDMNKIHPILTDDDDMVLVSLLAMTTDPVEKIVEDTESCYLIMKNKFHDLNAVQSLSHVMALQEGPSIKKCEKVEALFDAFKALKRRFPTDMALPTLGALLGIDMDPQALASEIVEAADYLKTFKGFGSFSMGNRTRLVLASLLACECFAEDKRPARYITYTNILTMLIAAEIVVAVTIATAATSASH